MQGLMDRADSAHCSDDDDEEEGEMSMAEGETGFSALDWVEMRGTAREKEKRCSEGFGCSGQQNSVR